MSILLPCMKALEANRLTDQVSFHRNVSEVDHPQKDYYKQPSDISKFTSLSLKRDFISPPYYPSRVYI